MDGRGFRRQVLRNFPRRDSYFSGARMAPMIDMVFLLLIFFLVAAKWRPEEDFLPIKLPSAQAGQNAVGRTEPLQIHIFSASDGCKVQIGEVEAVEIGAKTIEANLGELADRIEAVLSNQKRFLSDPVEIICEADVKSDWWVKIYNVLCGMKLADITFTMTEQPQGK
jgi:biopolymer transport protein ExbD